MEKAGLNIEMFQTMSPNATIIYRAFESLYGVSLDYQRNLEMQEYYKLED